MHSHNALFGASKLTFSPSPRGAWSKLGVVADLSQRAHASVSSYDLTIVIFGQAWQLGGQR